VEDQLARPLPAVTRLPPPCAPEGDPQPVSGGCSEASRRGRGRPKARIRRVWDRRAWPALVQLSTTAARTDSPGCRGLRWRRALIRCVRPPLGFLCPTVSAGCGIGWLGAAGLEIGSVLVLTAVIGRPQRQA
jgi:hypothetical protein